MSVEHHVLAATSSAATLDRWVQKAERLEVGKNLQYFNQGVGLKVDKKRLARLEADSLEHSELFVKSFGREPESLFLMSVNTIGEAKTYTFRLKLHEARISKISSKKHKVGGIPVNWGSWRQFAARTDDSAARKEVFDDFLEKSTVLAPLIKARFDGYSGAVSAYGVDPLSIYLKLERIDYGRLSSFVDRLGTVLRPVFRRHLARFSDQILGRDAEYYDDYYFFRTRIFRKYVESFPVKTEPVSQIISTMKSMGLDATKINVDNANRKGKSSSAFCAAIKVPSDVRISYRKSNPLENFTGVFHEYGHAIHFCSIDSDETFWNKYRVAMGVAEIFSIFFEGLMHDKLYLTGELGLSDRIASDLVRRFTFNQLYFAAFYSANSMMKLRYWREGLSIRGATKLYSDLTQKYIGIRYPGEYWYLHHVLPEYILYSPSYLLAAVRANELTEELRSRFGGGTGGSVVRANSWQALCGWVMESGWTVFPVSTWAPS